MKCPFVIRVCTKCKRILVANEMNFGKQKTCKFGFKSRCKKCEKQYKKKYNEKYKDKRKEYDKKRYIEHKEAIRECNKQWYKKHKEEMKEYNKRYYEDNKEEILEQHKKYREEHKKERKEQRKQYYEDNKEEILEQQKQYNKENPHISFNSQGKRRSREEIQGNGITKEQWFEMMEFFNWECAYSGIQLNKNNRSIDHIIPLSREGEHEPWNCVPMEIHLNTSKHANDMIDWYMEQDYFDIDRLLKIYEWIEYAWNKWKVVKIQDKIDKGENE